jgi:hypothetical protein
MSKNQDSSHFSRRAAGGGGNALPAFQSAIFFRISEDCSQVSKSERNAFAAQYAHARPHLLHKFDGKSRGGNNDVDQAVAAFQQHLQQSASQSHQAPYPLPHRLTARERLISDLIEHGINALPVHLQQKFQTVRKVEGLCFFIQHLDVEALQRSVCESSGLGVLLGFFDIFMSQEGLMLSFFAQKRFNGRPVQFRPASANSILLVCVRCFGSPRPVENQQIFLSDLDVVVRDSTSGYNKAGQVVSLDQQVFSANQDMRDEQRHSSKCLFVPQDEEDFLPSSISHGCDESSRQVCEEVMKRAGAIPIPFSSSSSATAATAATAATEVLAPSAPNTEEADIIFCQHLSVVKRKSGECTPCATCLEGPPGRGKIFDEWGKTIAYKYKN